MAVVLGVIAAGAAIFGAVQQRKVAKEQRRQNRVSNRIAANKRMRDIRRSIALARVRRAELQSQGFQLGVAGGSAVAGAVGALTTDVSTAIGASQQQFTGQLALTAISDRISRIQQNAATAQAIGSIASTFSGAAGAQNVAAVQDIAA